MLHLFTRETGAPSAKADRKFDEIVSLLDGSGRVSVAGNIVNSNTAMQQATVWACVRILSEVIASLPIRIQRLRGGTWRELDSHSALDLIHRPNNWQTPPELFSHLVSWSELRGNGYYFKLKNDRGEIGQLIPLKGDAVNVTQQQDWSITYSVSEANGFTGIFGEADVLHHRNFGTSGFMGLSTITNLRNAIGLAMRAEEHGGRLFSNGAQLGKHFKLGTGNAETIEAFRAKLVEHYSGAQNAHRPFVTGGDVEVTELGMTNTDAQFLETRKMQKQEIAGAFGVPLFVLNDTEKSTSWGTGLEQQLRAFKTLSLAPRLNRLVWTLRRELLPSAEQRRTRFLFETDVLTMADFQERMDGWRTAIESGVMAPNEVRQREGLNERENGDGYRIPVNIAIEGEQPPPAEAPPVETPPDEDESAGTTV